LLYVAATALPYSVPPGTAAVIYVVALLLPIIVVTVVVTCYLCCLRKHDSYGDRYDI